MSRNRKQLPAGPAEVSIESLSHEGRGIGHINGKTIFIDGALPGETVQFNYTSQRSRFDEGSAFEIANASKLRVIPGCKYFSICGGCSLQHIGPEAQIQHKENVLFEQLKHIGGVEPTSKLTPLTGQVWAYRHKARLGVRYVYKKNKLLVGFREKNKPYIADIDRCEVLHPAIGDNLVALKEVIGSLDIKDQIPQIEVAVGDGEALLVIRHLVDLSDTDRIKLGQFESKFKIGILMQGNHSNNAVPLTVGGLDSLTYTLADYGVTMRFSPLDFTQINFRINEQMISRAINLLQPSKSERLLDLFCGLGNFTLPLAKFAGFVTGIEGSETLVEKARANASDNGIENIEFQKSNLYSPSIKGDFLNANFDKILMDPPRSGAQEVIEQMDFKNIQRLVYVSCNPATLARDSGILVNKQGFKLVAAGVMDMFPHTTHVESIAVFERT